MDSPRPNGSPDPASPDDPLPIFGTWPRIYAAVIVSAFAVMGLIALFANWDY